MFIKKLGCITFALVLQACVTAPKYTPMTQQTKNAVASLEVYNLVMQDEVRPAVDVSNVSGAMGGGLIAAAIDSSINDDRASSARDLTDEFYILTEDLDYRALLAKSVNPVLADLKHKNPQNSTEVVPLLDKEIKQRVAALKQGEAFLFMTSHYTFLDGFKTLHTATTAYLYVGTGGKMDYTKASYMNNFMYMSPVVGSGGAGSIKLWSADKGKLFREQIQNSLKALQANMSYDMQPLANESCVKSMTFVVPTQMGEQKVTGNMLKTDADMSLVRTEDGGLYTIATMKLNTAKKNTCGGQKS